MKNLFYIIILIFFTLISYGQENSKKYYKDLIDKELNNRSDDLTSWKANLKEDEKNYYGNYNYYINNSDNPEIIKENIKKYILKYGQADYDMMVQNYNKVLIRVKEIEEFRKKLDLSTRKVDSLEVLMKKAPEEKTNGQYKTVWVNGRKRMAFVKKDGTIILQ